MIKNILRLQCNANFFYSKYLIYKKELFCEFNQIV
jgi:hypothetical protein